MRWVTDGVWLVVAVIAYATIGDRIAIGQVAPVLPVIVVVRVALMNGELPGNLFGFFCGLLLDLFALEWFGASMLVDSLIGYSVGALRHRVVVDNALVRGAVLLGAALAHTIGLLLVRSISGPVGPEPFLIAIGSGFYTAAIGALWWALIAFARAVFGLRSSWHAER